MALLPDVGLTNAYGLTETSSTIAILGPDDRAARRRWQAAIARLSAGRLPPTIGSRCGRLATRCRLRAGRDLVRGEQVSGEIRRPGGRPPTPGLVPDPGPGWLGGGLPVHPGPQRRHDHPEARNIAPAEIEEVLLQPGRRPGRGRGRPPTTGGQRIAAVVVLTPGGAVDAAGLQAFARDPGSKTPRCHVADSLPFTDTARCCAGQLQAGSRRGDWRRRRRLRDSNLSSRRAQVQPDQRDGQRGHVPLQLLRRPGFDARLDGRGRAWEKLIAARMTATR